MESVIWVGIGGFIMVVAEWARRSWGGEGANKEKIAMLEKRIGSLEEDRQTPKERELVSQIIKGELSAHFHEDSIRFIAIDVRLTKIEQMDNKLDQILSAVRMAAVATAK